MSDEFEIRNAIIKSTQITNSDHGCLTIWLNLDYGGSGQGFGGFSLYNPKQNSKNYAGLFIWRVLEVVDVTSWEHLVGKTIRVKSKHSEINAIGHVIEDSWFNPSEEFKDL